MPTVPRYDSQQVAPTATPYVPASDGGLATLQTADMVGRQTQALGNGMQKAGDAMSDIAIDMQQQANQVRVNDAVNQLRQAQLDLAFNPQTGYKNLKGDAALTRPDGKALPDEYGDKLQQTISSLSDNLGNDAQKRLFSLHADDIMTSFKGDVESHMLGEYRDYALSTQDGTIKVNTDAAKLNWSNPDKIAPAIDAIQAAVVRAGSISGDSASETMAKMKVATSAVHTGVIDAALQNNNPEYALAYLNSKKDQMTADDLLRTRAIINKDVYARVADGTASNVVNGLRTQVQPSDLDRMVNITRQTESNGNPNAIGPNVPGQGTAKGDMQVMDATNANPGFGVTPAKDNSPAERARVGADYMKALVQNYGGDPAKAWAAYNAGPGNVDKAIADAKNAGTPDAWMDALAKYQSPANHQQTVDYVNKNLQAFNTGGGSPPRPTLQDVHDGIRAKLGPNAQPEVLKMALEAGSKQWEDMNKALTAQGDSVVGQAQQWLISNNGDFTKLPTSLRTAVTQYAPGKMDDLMKFAKAVSKGDNETNMAAFNAAITYPEELAKMTDAQFLQFQKTNFSAIDQEKVARLRANEVNGDTDTSAGGMNSKAFNTTVNNRLTSIGINPTPDRKDMASQQRVGTIKKYLADSIYGQQQQLGRKMTPQEMSDHVDQVFAKDIAFRTSYLGGAFSRTENQNMLSMKVGDIPKDTRSAIASAFSARGVANPTDDQILRAYWTKKNAK